MFAMRRRMISMASRGPASLNGERDLAAAPTSRVARERPDRALRDLECGEAIALWCGELAGRCELGNARGGPDAAVVPAEATASACSWLYLRSKAGTRAADHARRVGCMTAV
jgi:hypothetical protein